MPTCDDHIRLAFVSGKPPDCFFQRVPASDTLHTAGPTVEPRPPNPTPWELIILSRGRLPLLTRWDSPPTDRQPSCCILLGAQGTHHFRCLPPNYQMQHAGTVSDWHRRPRISNDTSPSNIQMTRQTAMNHLISFQRNHCCSSRGTNHFVRSLKPSWHRVCNRVTLEIHFELATLM